MDDREALNQTAVDPLEEIDKIMERILERLAGDDVQLSFGDLILLLELRRELARSQPGRVTVGWIDGCPIPEE
jgi:hypothetical protein